jgi:hypothetical protein
MLNLFQHLIEILNQVQDDNLVVIFCYWDLGFDLTFELGTWDLKLVFRFTLLVFS